jgi:hypothetical protein
MAATSFVSVYGAAWLSVAVGILLGGPLAEVLQMYGGNTEPRLPSAPFPVLAGVACAVFPLPWVLRRQWTAGTLASLPLLLLPAWYVHTLYLLASGDPP